MRMAASRRITLECSLLGMLTGASWFPTSPGSPLSAGRNTSAPRRAHVIRINRIPLGPEGRYREAWCSTQDLGLLLRSPSHHALLGVGRREEVGNVEILPSKAGSFLAGRDCIVVLTEQQMRFASNADRSPV